MAGACDGGRNAEDLHAPVERISVIVPMRDELPNLAGFVADLAAQDFAGPVQVLVADGGSTDGSGERLKELAASSGLDLTVFHNPAGWVSHGLNLCIERATGDLVVRLDCHSRYPADYLRRLGEVASATGGWNVGGRTVARGVTAMERAVATAMVSPFGGIDWTRLDGEGGPVEVDTVKFGAFRPIAFREAGNYDEEMVRNQDDELNLRIEEAGGRIFLDPTITLEYLPRASLKAVWSQYSQYGFWKVAVMTKHRRVLTLRSMAPLAFVGSMVLLSVLAPFSRVARVALAGELFAYLAGALAFGAREAFVRGESLALLPRMLAVFPAFHLSYGAGMARGWVGWLRRQEARNPG
jgi:glycosyltransferase involved in cell wall biosynthesis